MGTQRHLSPFDEQSRQFGEELIMNTQDITQEQITEARDWASDCLGMVAETVTFNRALAYINAQYPGGWDAFAAEVYVDGDPVPAVSAPYDIETRFEVRPFQGVMAGHVLAGYYVHDTYEDWVRSPLCPTAEEAEDYCDTLKGAQRAEDATFEANLYASRQA
jgi:hypothetical protein